MLQTITSNVVKGRKIFKKHIFGSLAFIIVLITVISKGLTAAHLPNEGSRFGIFAGFVPKGEFCDDMGFNNYYEYTRGQILITLI